MHRRPRQKVERLEARVSPDTKALCQKAAMLQGRSVTDFVISSAVEAAKRIIHENEFIELSRQDRIAFVETLLDPPVPSVRLREAVRRHGRTVLE